MISNTPDNYLSRVYLKLGLFLLLSGFWYGLALILGETHPTTRLNQAGIILGGFLPAMAGLLLLRCIQAARKKARRLNLAWIIIPGIYPLFVSGALIADLFMRLPAGLPAGLKAWMEHPLLLAFNLMAVLLVGPIADITGLKDRLIAGMKKDLPHSKEKWIGALFWWLWHIPFIFVNGTALAGLNISELLLGGYLLVTLGLSFFFTWGYDRKRRQVLLTAIKHY